MDEEEVLFEAKRKRRRSTPFPYEYDGQNYFCFGSDLEALFFERKDEAVVRCKVEGCPYPLYKQRFGRGYSNVKSHLITHHRDRWQKDIFDALRPNQFDEENGEGALTIASSATKKGAASTIPSSPKTPAPSSSKTTAKGKNGDQKTPKTTLKSTPVTSSWASSTLPLTTSTAVAATSANNTTTTTTTTTTKPLLSESFKKKLYRRKIGNEHECELCSQIIGDLEIIQLIDIKYKQQYEKDFPFNRQLPASLYDANNGLLLCCNCYFKYNSYIEEEGGGGNGSASSGGGRCIQIDCTGTIHLYGFAKKINYLKLDGKKVPWADLIDHDHHYPSSATLEYALNLQTSKKNKRSRDEAMMDTTDEEKEKGVKTIDQRSIESIEDDDSEEDESN